MMISMIVFCWLVGCVLATDRPSSSGGSNIDVERDLNVDPCWDYEPTK